MKINKLITAALISVGLVSAASASSTVTISGTTYTVVYITGSTAFRANVFNAVDNGTGSWATNSGSSTLGLGVFDTTPTLQPTTATGGTSVYNAYGTINGTPYLLSFDFTGSEAGIASLENSTITYSVPNNAFPSSPSSGVATLPGTPTPLGFINPTSTGNTIAGITPDLAFADTSVAVSLSPASGVKEDGIVGVIPFEWVKGKSSSASSSYTDLVNVTTPEVLTLLGTGKQGASYFTKNPSDTDNVYLIGRNKGSGTRVNTLLEPYYGVTTAVKQYAPGNSSYVSGVLTVGSVTALSTSGNGLVYISNEGFDAGSGVAKTLEDDVHGYTLGSKGVITLGYLGISDATGTAIPGGAVALTLDGVAESDASVILGTYPFWGHEHLYGLTTQSSSTPGGIIADVFTGLYSINGGTPNSGLSGNSAASGALEASGFAGGGGDEASSAWATTQSSALDASVMECDKASDAGYPTQQ